LIYLKARRPAIAKPRRRDARIIHLYITVHFIWLSYTITAGELEKKREARGKRERERERERERKTV